TGEERRRRKGAEGGTTSAPFLSCRLFSSSPVPPSSAPCRPHAFRPLPHHPHRLFAWGGRKLLCNPQVAHGGQPALRIDERQARAPPWRHAVRLQQLLERGVMRLAGGLQFLAAQAEADHQRRCETRAAQSPCCTRFESQTTELRRQIDGLLRSPDNVGGLD